jgi:hypothetical protein
MNINFDQSITQKLNTGMNISEGVSLPFPVVYFWTINGQSNYKAQGGALYHGGWASKLEEVQAVCDMASVEIPMGMQMATMSTKDGNEYEALITRDLWVAPIAKRESWRIENKRFSHYIEGARRHLQVLVYMFEKSVDENRQVHVGPWGPAVLSAKGYQARNLLDALTQWDKATAQIRMRIAKGAPAYMFRMCLGTFGKERKVIQVGKTATSPITPVGAYIPDSLTDEKLADLFVGNEILTIMSEYQDQAQEWLNEWKKSSSESPAETEPAASPDLDENMPF